MTSAQETNAALKTQKLTMCFGGLTAVCDLDLEVKAHSIFGIIGPNGAGKTTVFNMLTGVYCPTSGEIIALGKSVVGLAPYEIAAHGMSRTFQNIRLFKDLTVIENLIVALDQSPRRKKISLLANMFRAGAYLREEESKIAEAASLLELLGLSSRMRVVARNLPYGDQRRLEIARALATGAKILLLDEPAAGMTAGETDSLMQTIKLIRDRFGITIILIEHDMELVMGICERIAVLDYGKKIAEGSAAQIQSDAKVIEAYLGKRKEETPT